MWQWSKRPSNTSKSPFKMDVKPFARALTAELIRQRCAVDWPVAGSSVRGNTYYTSFHVKKQKLLVNCFVPSVLTIC